MGRCVAFGCEEIGSHKFPSNPTLRRKWERALRRVNFKATDYSRLCIKHFKVTDFETMSKETGFPLQWKLLKKSAVPTLFSWNSVSGQGTSARAERLERRNVKRCLIPTVAETDESVVENSAVAVTNDSTDQGYAHEFEISGISDENSESVVHSTGFSVNQNYVKIDGTEIPITKPKNPTSQKATFSSYKNKNTMKFLVGAAPGGLFTYFSEGYGGSTSDRQMIERSSLLEKCEPRDSIMADHGFNVQDIFAAKGIGINIPTWCNSETG